MFQFQRRFRTAMLIGIGLTMPSSSAWRQGIFAAEVCIDDKPGTAQAPDSSAGKHAAVRHKKD